MKPGDFTGVSVSKLLHCVQSVRLLNAQAEGVHKRSEIVSVHVLLGCLPLFILLCTLYVVCVCVRTHVHGWVHVCVHAHVHGWVCGCMHACVRPCAHEWVGVRTCAWVGVRVCVCNMRLRVPLEFLL
jgi:hypothetical protein